MRLCKKIDYLELSVALKEFISPGDSVLVHSRLSAFGWFSGGPEAIIKELINLVGKKGNLVMPTATTSFSKTRLFNVNCTPSETGLLSEIFRKTPGVQRSCVPMSSFAAYGPQAEDFTRPYNSYLDPESPFSALLSLNGKIILFGVDYRACTLYHLSEERFKVNYNFYKVFRGNIIGHDNKLRQDSQRYFVRKNLSLKKNPNKVGKEFECNNMINKIRLGNGTIKIFNARLFDKFCMEALLKNRNVFVDK